MFLWVFEGKTKIIKIKRDGMKGMKYLRAVELTNK
jgi:hypothetical protein